MEGISQVHSVLRCIVNNWEHEMDKMVLVKLVSCVEVAGMIERGSSGVAVLDSNELTRQNAMCAFLFGS